MPRYRLRFRCPFCPNSTEVIDWKHGPCGEREEIDEDGNVWCTKCYKVYSLILMTFKCRHCPYKSFDLHDHERTYEIFKILCSINEEIGDKIGDKKFMGNLIHNVFKRACE